jgi:hypothetical protein
MMAKANETQEPKDTMFPDMSAVFAEQDKRLKECWDKERKALDAIFKPLDEALRRIEL